jgi:hypothetical protein
VDAVSGHRPAVGVSLIMAGSSDHDFDAGHHHAFVTLSFPYRSVLAARPTIGRHSPYGPVVICWE